MPRDRKTHKQVQECQRANLRERSALQSQEQTNVAVLAEAALSLNEYTTMRIPQCHNENCLAT